MHETSDLWKRIFAEPDHRKQIKVTINGNEYNESRIIRVSVNGQLFDAPSVGGAVSRTLELTVMPLDGANGYISPLSEIRLYVRLVSADGQRVSEYIPKGIFYADNAKRDYDTGAVTVSAFDAMMKMGLPFGEPKDDGSGGDDGGYGPVKYVTVTFFDGFQRRQKFTVLIGDPMPTPETPTRPKERFLRWYPNPADTPTVLRDMHFTAQWVRKFTVTFKGGGGTPSPQVFTCFEGDATPTPTTPTKEGYDFLGWTPTPSATVTADATYTAQWEWARYVIAAYPTKSDYIVSETLDYTGLVVEERFEDGTAARDITADCVLLPAEGYEITEPGDIMVSVSYDGAEIGTFWAAVVGVEITTYPEKPIYAVGDTLDYTGLTITGTFPDGTTRDITPYCTFDPPEGTVITEPGTIPVTVSYNGVAATEFEVEAAGVIASGDWWTLYDTGLLDIYCVGNMPNYGVAYNSSPWHRYRTSITSVIISDSVTSIGDYAFGGCANLTSVTIPNSVTFIGDDAFDACISLTSVTIPNSVTFIGGYAFSACISLTSVTISNSVTLINGGLFQSCRSLTSVTIPNSVTRIYNYAFGGCANLTSVTIPNSVTFIGEGVFQSCANLTDIYYSGTETQWNAITIEEKNNDPLKSATIHYNSSGP